MNDYSAVSRAERMFDYNSHYINDLPATSPHGSYSDITQQICDFQLDSKRDTWHSDGTP